MPTKQETFDTVVSHLRRQGRRSFKEGFGCCYRMGELKCAAGCLIPDDNYRKGIEGYSILTFHRTPTPAGQVIGALGHDLQLTSDLQVVHDSLLPRGWEGELARVAAKHGLTYTPPGKESN